MEKYVQFESGIIFTNQLVKSCEFNILICVVSEAKTIILEITHSACFTEARSRLLCVFRTAI